MSHPALTAYMAQAVGQALPPDNAIRTGEVVAIDGGTVRALVNGGVVQAGYLTSYEPRVQDTVALTRQDAGWLILGSLYGDSAPAPVNPFADPWHIASLQNSWTHRATGYELQYRLFHGPGNIQITGQITPGTLTDGTIVTTLPSGYRPNAERIFSARKGAGTRAIFALQPNGQLLIFDAAGSSLIQLVEAVIPLDTITL